MEKPDDVAAMLRLHAAGWGVKRIAAELGCSKNTVKRYIRQGGWKPYVGGSRATRLEGQEPWLEAALIQHGGNAEVVRQELVRQHKIRVSLRTVQRAVAPHRRRLRAATLGTVRFETPPGKQLQADFGEIWVQIGGQRTRVHLCVLTLSWSRRIFVRAFQNERQANWLTTMEDAFRHFAGVPEEVLIDNARALVTQHDVSTGEVVFSARFGAFARYWGFRPRACAPYRPRTKGKDERGVGYVKRNAIAGRTFDGWESLAAWLTEWMRDISDERVHGTTGEKPSVRFARQESAALRRLPDLQPFQAERELERIVHNDACVEVDANWYSVPWQLVKATVTVRVRDRLVTIHHGGQVVARHERADGPRQRVVDDEHWKGLVRGPEPKSVSPDASPPVAPEPEFLRSLDVYAELADGVAA
jgi:transposase